MKVLTGQATNDEGRIFIRGKEEKINDIRDSQKLSIAIIHQELNLMTHLTVAQNIFIGRESWGKSHILLNDEDIVKKSRKIFEKLT